MINQDILENQANRIYLGIGSNLGNRRYKIEQAKYELTLRILDLSNHQIFMRVYHGQMKVNLNT